MGGARFLLGYVLPLAHLKAVRVPPMGGQAEGGRMGRRGSEYHLWWGAGGDLEGEAGWGPGEEEPGVSLKNPKNLENPQTLKNPKW